MDLQYNVHISIEYKPSKKAKVFLLFILNQLSIITSYLPTMSQTLECGVFQPDQRTAALPSYSPYPSTYQGSHHQAPTYNQVSYNQPSYNQAPHHQPATYNQAPHYQPSYEQAPYHQPATYNQVSHHQPTHHSSDSAGWVDESPRKKHDIPHSKHDSRTELREARRKHRDARREHREARRQLKRERRIKVAVGTYHAAKTATMFIYNSVSGPAKKPNGQRPEAHLA